MIRLYDLENNLLSKGIKSLSPILYDGIKIENQLLDGSLHIQTIGDPQRYFNFELLANHTQVDVINNINAQGGRLKVVIDGDYYEGYCNTEDWQRITMRHLEESDRYYTTTVKFIVWQSGVV